MLIINTQQSHGEGSSNRLDTPMTNTRREALHDFKLLEANLGPKTTLETLNGMLRMIQQQNSQAIIDRLTRRKYSLQNVVSKDYTIQEATL